AALARADEPWQQLDNGNFRQSLVTIAQNAGDTRGIETGACRFGEGMRLQPEWRAAARQPDDFEAGRRARGRMAAAVAATERFRRRRSDSGQLFLKPCALSSQASILR